MSADLIALLRSHGVQPTPQRLAVADAVLNTTAHPTAEEVWQQASKDCPTLSRATVYNTLNLLAEKGLLKPQAVREGVVVFDAHVERHHHFIDEETGAIHDVPWDAVAVRVGETLQEFDVKEYQVVMRGRRRRQ
jgi:Fe2+ or Zn2+ uptake regulation protein